MLFCTFSIDLTNRYISISHNGYISFSSSSQDDFLHSLSKAQRRHDHSYTQTKVNQLLSLFLLGIFIRIALFRILPDPDLF